MMMMPRILLLFVLLVMVVSIPLHQPALAQSTDITGIDVVFLVDQSGSMGGAAFGFPDREATDPEGLRFSAVDYALSTLAAYRQSIAPELDIQMAVVAFGDDTLEVLDWTPIADPTSPIEWSVREQELSQSLSADRFREQLAPDPANLGNTNFIAAFENAQALFDRQTASGNRLGVVILLTDGEPCVVSGDDAFSCGNFVLEQEYMQDLLTFTNDSFSEQDYKLYTLVLDASGELWDTWRADWQSIVTEPDNAMRVESSQEVGAQFLTILRDVVGFVTGQESIVPSASLSIGENRIFVPPYQQLMRISIFKATADSGLVTIQQPDGQLLTTDSSNLDITNPASPIEIWGISNPIPGEWLFTLDSTADQLDVFLEFIPINVDVALGNPDVKLLDDVSLTLSLLNEDGNLLPVYPAPYDQVSVEATVDYPDGTSEVLLLSELSQSVYTNTFIAQQIGTYRIGFLAVLNNPDGTTTPLFSDNTALQFSVGGYAIELTTLPQAEYLKGEPVTIGANLSDGNIEDLSDLTITATVTSGGDVLQAQPLTLSDGEYQTSLSIDAEGSYQITLNATTTDRTGQQIILDTIESDSFTILPSLLVGLQILSPDDGSSDVATEGLQFNTRDLVISFQAILEDGNVIDIQNVAEQPETLLTVTVLDSDNQQVTTITEVTPITGGAYEVLVPELGTGDYTIEVSAQGVLEGRYVVHPVNNTARITVTRTMDFVSMAAWGAIAVLGIVVLGLGGFGVRRSMARREHPARGKLSILEVAEYGEDIRPIFTVDLGAYNRNYIVLKKLPKAVKLNRIIVECTDDSMYKRKRILLTAYRGKKAVIQSKTLSPGATVRVRLERESGISQDASYQIALDYDSFGGGVDDGFF